MPARPLVLLTPLPADASFPAVCVSKAVADPLPLGAPVSAPLLAARMAPSCTAGNLDPRIRRIPRGTQSGAGAKIKQPPCRRAQTDLPDSDLPRQRRRRSEPNQGGSLRDFRTAKFLSFEREVDRPWEEALGVSATSLSTRFPPGGTRDHARSGRTQQRFFVIRRAHDEVLSLEDQSSRLPRTARRS